jgi:hypothetical protein
LLWLAGREQGLEPGIAGQVMHIRQIGQTRWQADAAARVRHG